MFPGLASNSLPGLEPGTPCFITVLSWDHRCATPPGIRMSLVSVGLSFLTCKNWSSECFYVLGVLWIDVGGVPSIALACKASSTR